MKTIIVGTDFTNASINACRYAAELARATNCKLVLFNLFEAPLIHSNVGLYGFSYSSLLNNSLVKTNKVILQLKKEFPKLKISSFNIQGSFKDELKDFIKKHRVEAAVMGLETKKKMSKFIYGSHGVNLVGKINCPVIIVPSSYRKHKLKKILLTVDNNEKLHKSSLKGFERFVKEASLNLKVLHVRTEDEIFDPLVSELMINGKKTSIELIKAKDIQGGIRKYCTLVDIDLVAIISKKHSVFYNLFSESNTKKIAFVSKLPVMSIHE